MQSSLVTPKALGKIGASLSPSKLPNILAGLIIFLASTQLGLHFWPPSSLVYGIRIDYLSPTLYFLDFLIIMFLCLQGLTLKDEPNPADSTAGKVRPYWNLIVPILLTNLLYSTNPLATLSWSLHLILYLLFVATLRADFKGAIVGALSISLLFQLILALTQTSLGHSVGGLLYYLGERTVAVGSPGIALGSFMDKAVLRAYGTFGHPNVLAGWSVIVLLILLRLRGDSSQARFPWLPTIFTILLVLLTQSRAAALSLFGFIIPLYWLKNLKSRTIYFMFSLLVCWFVFPSLLSPPRSSLSLSERRTLQDISLSTLRAYPGFGVGANASISVYPTVAPGNRLLQPDHNSFTLFLSWFGLFGILAILYSLRPFDIRHSLFSVLPLLPLLLLDHYLLTSPQGLFILMIYAAIALNYSHAQIDRQ